jgi:hypothetical protein
MLIHEQWHAWVKVQFGNKLFSTEDATVSVPSKLPEAPSPTPEKQKEASQFAKLEKKTKDLSSASPNSGLFGEQLIDKEKFKLDSDPQNVVKV